MIQTVCSVSIHDFDTLALFVITSQQLKQNSIICLTELIKTFFLFFSYFLIVIIIIITITTIIIIKFLIVFRNL